MASGPEPMYTVAEVAQAWGLSKNTVYDYIAANELGFVDVGRGRVRTRIPQSAIEAFCAKRGRNLVTPSRKPAAEAA